MTDSPKLADLASELKELAVVEAKRGQIQAAIDTANADIDTLNEEMSPLFEKRNASEQKIAEIEKTLSRDQLSHEARAELKDELANAAEEMAKLDKQIQAVKGKIAILIKKRSELQKKLAERDASLQALKDKIAGIIAGRIQKHSDRDGYVNKALKDCFDVEHSTANQPERQLSPAIDAAGTVQISSSDGARASAESLFLRSSELENRIQAILDQLTDRRIAEEMDTATYLFRLQTAFKRAGDRATHLSGAIFDRFQARISEVAAELEHARQALHIDIAALPDSHFDQKKQEWMRISIADHEAIAAQLGQITTASEALRSRLRKFADEICADGKFDQTRDISRKVSRAIERGKNVRVLPLGVAALTTLLAKVGINLTESAYLASKTTVILSVIFSAAYVLSLWCGIHQRKSIMKNVKGFYQDAVDKLFSSGADAQDFRFKKLHIAELTSQDVDALLTKPAIPISPDAIQTGPTWAMVRKNFLIIVFPAMVLFLLGFVNTDQSGGRVALQGQNADGQACILATGQITGESEGAYFLIADDNKANKLGKAFLPELYAASYAKPAVHAVRSAQDNDDIEHCDTFKPAVPLQVHQFSVEAPAVEVQLPIIETPGGCGDPAQCPKPPVNLEERFTSIEDRIKTLASGQTSALDLQKSLISIIHNHPDRQSREAFGEVLIAVANGLKDLTDRPVAPELNVEYHLHESPATSDTEKVFWDFSLVVNDRVVFRDNNALLINFFPIDVSGTNNNEPGAFAAGRESLQAGHSNEAFTHANQYYLDRLVNKIRKRLDASDAPLLIELKGLASDPWKSVGEQEERDALNHALAEGRRAAVLDYVLERFKKDGPDGRNDALLRLNLVYGQSQEANTRPCIPLSDAPSKLTWGKSDLFAFQEPDDMIAARQAIIAEGQISSEVDYADFVGRSVMVRVTEGSCAM